jgi:hypothetical protein
LGSLGKVDDELGVPIRQEAVHSMERIESIVKDERTDIFPERGSRGMDV